jgi:hypothetical protein|tara:strand:- start:170 stop:643 length:474 start_codon:yes stop_codon:yes gene_type:complete
MADLTVTLTEAVTLNGSSRGSTNTLTVSGVDDIYHRIVTVPNGVDTTLASFKSTVGIADGSLDLGNVKYIRVTNMDASNSVNLSLQVETGNDDSAADHSATILLEAKKSFLMGTPDAGVAVSTTNATIITALEDLESIIADSGSNDVQCEIFIASVV